jgi:hypothetical protein
MFQQITPAGFANPQSVKNHSQVTQWLNTYHDQGWIALAHTGTHGRTHGRVRERQPKECVAKGDDMLRLNNENRQRTKVGRSKNKSVQKDTRPVGRVAWPNDREGRQRGLKWL